MKNLTTLFTLALGAALMVVSSGCKHSSVDPKTILGPTLIPGQRGSTNTTPGSIKSNPNGNGNGNMGGGIGHNPGIETLPPIKTTDISTTIDPNAGVTNIDSGMGFSTNSKWAPVWDSPLTPDSKFFEKDKVYFELDSSVIRAGEQSKLEDIANYFKTDNKDVLLIEGHCDERGTELYNVALGDRRALAVREYLINLGMDSGRIHTVSYGESRPEVQGHNDAAWSKNRRGIAVLMRPTGAGASAESTFAPEPAK